MVASRLMQQTWVVGVVGGFPPGPPFGGVVGVFPPVPHLGGGTTSSSHVGPSEALVSAPGPAS
eukprot:9101669-Lingulodinium_polyedra.AAC.1